MPGLLWMGQAEVEVTGSLPAARHLASSIPAIQAFPDPRCCHAPGPGLHLFRKRIGNGVIVTRRAGPFGLADMEIRSV